MKENVKTKAPTRDAKKLLQSYKDTRKMDINEGLPKMVDEWTPLEYLRHFAVYKKKVSVDPRYIYFGKVKFVRNTKSNFQAEYGDQDEDGMYPWYTLDHLYQAYLSKVGVSSIDLISESFSILSKMCTYNFWMILHP